MEYARSIVVNFLGRGPTLAAAFMRALLNN